MTTSVNLIAQRWLAETRYAPTSSSLRSSRCCWTAARKIAGRDVKQILMIQANQLTSDLLDELLRWYKAMGVRFISIDEALGDVFYATEDVTNTASQIIWETRRAQMGVAVPEQ